MGPERAKQYLEMADQALATAQAQVEDWFRITQSYPGFREEDIQTRDEAVSSLHRTIKRADEIARLANCLKQAPPRQSVLPWAEVDIEYFGDPKVAGSAKFIYLPYGVPNPSITGIPPLLHERVPVVKTTRGKRAGETFRFCVEGEEISGVIRNIT